MRLLPRWMHRRDPDEVFEDMFAHYIEGFERGSGRRVTDAERAEARERWELNCAGWHTPSWARSGRSAPGGTEKR